jgi:hypothetical protein
MSLHVLAYNLKRMMTIFGVGGLAVQPYRSTNRSPQPQHRSEYRSFAVMRNAHTA